MKWNILFAKKFFVNNLNVKHKKMKSKTLLFIAISIIFMPFESNAIDNNSLKAARFDIDKDLLLIQFDCKTDVDDLHTAAALVTLLTRWSVSC